MKTVFIAHQVSGNVEANIRSALRWARWALLLRDVVPVVPYVYFCMILTDSTEYDRQLGMKCSMEILRRCEEVWICGPLPEDKSGVWEEVKEAEKMSKKIMDFTGLSLPPGYADFTQD